MYANDIGAGVVELHISRREFGNMHFGPRMMLMNMGVMVGYGDGPKRGPNAEMIWHYSREDGLKIEEEIDKRS